MRFEGNFEVLLNAFRKQRLMQVGDMQQYHYRHSLFASTGLRLGAVGAGQARELERQGLNAVYQHVAGTSTGAAMLQFFPGCQIEECIDIYWREAASRNFFDPWRLLTGGTPAQDTHFLSECFRQRLNIQTLHSSRTELWVGVTCALTGKGRLINAKTATCDPIEAVRASMSIAGLCGEPVVIDGNPYYDGLGDMVMPVREIIEQFEPTDLLILANRPDELKNNMLQQIVMRGLMFNCPLLVQRAVLDWHKVFVEQMAYLRAQKRCRWAILWSDDQIGAFESDPAKIKSAADRAGRHFARLLSVAKAQVDREFESIAAE